MRIALLNLPVDNNYGGNLQRYALMKVLQDMGHDVTHLNVRFYYHLPWFKVPYSFTKRFILKYIFCRDIKIHREQYLQQLYERHCTITEPFYQRYIKHTEPITEINQLKNYHDFDAYVVGSDQVWRKNIAKKYLNSMFLNFLPLNTKTKRIAYGVSLGVVENELSDKDIKKLSKLYKQFNAVSVREKSALDLFKQYGWNQPQAIQVLDPTLLLSKNDYMKLIENGITRPSEGNLFCYILDNTEEKNDIIQKKAKELHLKPFSLGLQGDNPASIEQWLRSFVDADFVITDSFHGLVFSIIFNKSFYLFKNEFRGNTRFESICNLLNVDLNVCEQDWEIINQKKQKEILKSKDYLIASIV